MNLGMLVNRFKTNCINKKYCFLIIFNAVSLFLIYALFLHKREPYYSLVHHKDGINRVMPRENSDGIKYLITECVIPEWNQIHTDSIPNTQHHEKWKGIGIGRKAYLYHDSPSILAAFAYKDHIAVTMTSENHYGRNVWCRYFDCMHQEIEKPYLSSVFPEGTVFCGRRVGAVYIAITGGPRDYIKENPVKIQQRTEPQHFFTVCLATLYGDEPKWLQIADFIEFYKLQGATFFHIYLRNVTNYDRLILDDYVRTGEVEVIRMHDHFWRADFMWHSSQINDCHFRSKHFSKWTAFLDIDEKLEMKTPEFMRIRDFLRSITDPSIAELMFKVQWVQKSEDDPPRYINETHLQENLIFRKFNLTSTKIGGIDLQPKVIVRPELAGVMFMHWASAKYPGAQRKVIGEDVALVRHYRSLKTRSFNKIAIQRIEGHGPYIETKIAPWLDQALSRAVTKRIRYVYDTVDFPCGKKQLAYFRHGEMNAPCYIDMVNGGEALVGTL